MGLARQQELTARADRLVVRASKLHCGAEFHYRIENEQAVVHARVRQDQPVAVLIDLSERQEIKIQGSRTMKDLTHPALVRLQPVQQSQ